MAPQRCSLELITWRSVVANTEALGEGLLDAADHPFEPIDLGFDALAAGFGAFDAQTQLEILLIADKDVGDRGDFGEVLAQFRLATFPERGAIVQVEGDAGVVLLGKAGQLQTELAGLGRQSTDQTGQMDDLDALFAKDPFQIKVLHVQRAAHLAGTVVPNAGPTASQTRCRRY